MSFVNLSWKFAFTDDFAHRHKIVYHHCWFPSPVYQDDHRCHDLQLGERGLAQNLRGGGNHLGKLHMHWTQATSALVRVLHCGLAQHSELSTATLKRLLHYRKYRE